jgi:hypothetical protein
MKHRITTQDVIDMYNKGVARLVIVSKIICSEDISVYDAETCVNEIILHAKNMKNKISQEAENE